MANRQKIAFYAGSCIPIHAGTLHERPLGGTETALIRVAEVLQKRGHDVTVFTSHPAPPASTPRYIPAGQVLRHGPFDIFVVIQEWKPVMFSLPAPRVWWWTGDGPEIYSNFGIGDSRAANKIEKFLAVSTYHADALCKESGFPRERAFIIGNGVHLEYFQGSETRERKRLIFTSAPYRGLQLVPPLLNALRQRHPDLTFHGFTGMSLYDREKPFEGPHVQQFREIAKVLTKIPGVTLHGNVPQAALAREYMRSSIFFYPSTVPETCCISALEAQAAGCALVTSAMGALPETTGESGIVVQGQVGKGSFMNEFAQATDKLLSDDAFWKKCSEKGLERAKRDLSWERVVDRIEALF
jgi:glycosyltransferase involved in cell wall biosynthesis